MTPLEIAELFIRGAEVDRRLPQTAKPKQLKAQSLPYSHDLADMNGWGAERYQEEREAFFHSRLSHEQVGEWERCMELIKHCPDEGRRRCLWNWAMAQVGGKPFGRWCREQGFHVETGRRRKNRAILEIFGEIARINGQNYKNGLEGVLHVCPENGHIQVTIGDRAPDKQPLHWRHDKAISSEEDRSFEWAEARNERRRQKYAERRKAA